MSFSRDLIDKYAPGADCVPSMKVWKLPEGKEHMFTTLCNSGGYFAELKKDGYWYQFEKTEKRNYLFSRNISTTTGILTDKVANVPHIEHALDTLPVGTILIGEVYYPGKTSKDVTRVMGCLAPEAIKRQAENDLIHFYVHDIIKYNGINIQNEGAWNRYSVLQEVWTKYKLDSYDFMELAKVVTEDIQDFVADALRAGEEGAVLKKKDAIYSPDKRPAWSSIKIKKIDYIDVICIGFNDATVLYTGKEIENWEYWINSKTSERMSVGKHGSKKETSPVTKGYYYGWKNAMVIGAFDENGAIKEIGTISSGLTDELREDFSKNEERYLNRVVSIQCMEKDSEKYTLRHGFFKGFRDDKNCSDCTIDIIFDKS